jgi:hypothetical protein
MKWTLNRTQLLFCAAFILSYFVVHAYSRWNAGADAGWGAGSLPPQAAGTPVEETRSQQAAATPAERVFVVAKRAPDVALPGDSTILVCERGEAAENAVRMLERRGYSSIRVVPGAAAVAAESHARHRSERLADGCTEWRPFAL